MAKPTPNGKITILLEIDCELLAAYIVDGLSINEAICNTLKKFRGDKGIDPEGQKMHEGRQALIDELKRLNRTTDSLTEVLAQVERNTL